MLERQVQDYNASMRQAWTVAGLMRTKKMPELSKLLIGQTKSQSVREQLEVIKVLSQRYGGSVQACG